MLKKFRRSIYQFSDLKILDQNVLKLTPERLISMDIHSRSDIVAIIGCDRNGTVGLVVKVNEKISSNHLPSHFSSSLLMISRIPGVKSIIIFIPHMRHVVVLIISNQIASILHLMIQHFGRVISQKIFRLK